MALQNLNYVCIVEPFCYAVSPFLAFIGQNCHFVATPNLDFETCLFTVHDPCVDKE